MLAVIYAIVAVGFPLLARADEGAASIVFPFVVLGLIALAVRDQVSWLRSKVRRHGS